MLLSVRVLAAPVLVLKGPNLAPYKEALNGFRQAFAGGVEVEHGKTRDFLSRVQSDHPSLIVAIGRVSAEMAHQQAAAVPLVFVMVPDPAGSGLTGNNVAGVLMEVPGSVQLARFKEILPNLTKPIAVVYNSAKSAALVADAQAAAAGLNLQLETVPVQSADQVAMRITMVKPIIGAIWVVPEENFAIKEGDKWFTDLVRQTIGLRLPLFMTMNPSSGFVEKGALAAVVSDYLAMGRQCGELVKEIEAGKVTVEKAGPRPPAAIQWQVNLGTAEKIGLSLPPTVLNIAKTYH